VAFAAHLALRKSKDAGRPLPNIPELHDLYKAGFKPRVGELALIYGQSGSQKSGFATWLAVKWGVDVIYFSADMSQRTASHRLASVYADMTSDEVAELFASDDPYDQQQANQLTERLRHCGVSFVFDSAPSLDDIDAEIEAWVELHDSYPDVIIVDNLLDVEPLNENEFASQKAILLELKTLARVTGAFVLVLAHAKEQGDPYYPAPKSGLQNKVSNTPALMLSIALEPSAGDTAILRLAPVKLREGASDPTGRKYVELIATPAKTQFRMKPPAQQHWASA
jgi:hypothetical protein